MKVTATAFAFLLVLGSAAFAQDPSAPLLGDSDFEWEEETRELSTLQEDWTPPPSIGLRAGFLRTADAEGGEWYGGIQVTYSFDRMFSLRASIEFHQDEFEDITVNGTLTDVDVTSYPVTVSLFFTPVDFGGNNKMLGLLAGAGWYYTRYDYSADPPLEEETDSVLGVHVGVAGMLWVSDSIAFGAEIIWHFLDVDEDNLGDERSDFIEFGFSINYSFGS